MNEFVIHFIGIVMFMHTPIGGVQDARHVVIPRFDRPADVIVASKTRHAIEAHIPYIAFTTDACGDPPCVDLSEWPGEPKQIKRGGGVPWAYLELDDVHLTVVNSQNPLTFGDELQPHVPRLSEYCPGLVFPAEFETDDKPHPRKAATIDVATGRLIARGDISRDKAIMRDWQVQVAGDLVIEARPYDGSATKRLRMKPGPDPNAIHVEIGNAPRDYIENPDATHHPTTPNHFLIYYTAGMVTPADVPYQTPCSRNPRPHNDDPTAVPGLAIQEDKGRLPSADCSNTDYP